MPTLHVGPVQVFYDRPYNAVAADLWSLAMTLFVMLFGCECPGGVQALPFRPRHGTRTCRAVEFMLLLLLLLLPLLLKWRGAPGRRKKK